MARTYSKTCQTWELFEAAFIKARGKNKQGDWLQIPCESKGRAINLTQGMNACNIQYLTEQNIPLAASDISARPLEITPGVWVVSLGPSYAHRARRSSAIDQMLEKLNADITPIEEVEFNPFNRKDPDDPDGLKKQAAEEARIRKMMGLE